MSGAPTYGGLAPVLPDGLARALDPSLDLNYAPTPLAWSEVQAGRLWAP